MVSEYDKNGKPLGGKADIIDGKILKPQQWYIVEGGKWVAVDFTDGIFSYVLSVRAGVKKVKTETGDILYIVSDGENHAHGKTIKEARESLIYKISDRDISEFEGLTVDDELSFKDVIAMYRAVTGACAEGTRLFVEKNKEKKKEKYKLSEIVKLTEGQYGHDKFKEFLK